MTTPPTDGKQRRVRRLMFTWALLVLMGPSKLSWLEEGRVCWGYWKKGVFYV